MTINMEFHQHTIRHKATFCGIGLHSGRPVRLSILPAAEDSGVSFFRQDLGPGRVVPAVVNRVVDTRLATTIAADGAVVATTEHLLAALAGLGIDNVMIELDGPEVPIMDGSAGPFVHVLKKIGRRRQKKARRFMRITEEILFQDGDRKIAISPYDGFKITSEIDFEHQAIQRQAYTFEWSPQRFANEIAAARTFGFLDQIEKLRENGLALGGSLENAVVMDRLGVLNQDGLRFADEFVRHKVLDLIGDLVLLGCPLYGHIRASRSGHAQHLGLMQAIAANPERWQLVEPGFKGGRLLEKVVSSTWEVSQKIMPLLTPSVPDTLVGRSAAA